MASGGDAREVFSQIYESSGWGKGGSGQGSRSNVTEIYRALVECLIGSGDIRSVVDAGCGDWEFARLIDWSPVDYTGLDVVPAVIERNRNDYAGSKVRFDCLDFSDSPMPRADLLLCKDVLQHWPVEWIQRLLRRVRGDYRYVVLTNDVASIHCPPESLNTAIGVGGWRTLDLERPPFGLRPDWSLDYDIRGEWTKRILLMVAGRHKLRSIVGSASALNRVRRRDWTIEQQQH